MLLQRLSAFYSDAFVAGVAAELAEARKVSDDDADCVAENRVAQIHARFTCRSTMGLALGPKSGRAELEKRVVRPQMNTAERLESDDGSKVLKD